MFLNKNLSVNEKGNLAVGGVDVLYLKEKYGTPLYVMDEDIIRENMSAFKTAIDKYYNGNGMPLYASKAFCAKYMCKIAEEEGFGLDVVSGGELYTAIKADFPAEKIYFHGNNKTPDEIELALSYNVGRIVVDNIYELNTLNKIAAKMDKKQKILFRIKPGIDAHTHDFIQTGQIDSKFGFALETGEALDAFSALEKCESLIYEGVHCHIGSQIFDIAPFVEASKVMMKFIAEIYDKFALITNELNLGGGFGIKYTEKDDPEEFYKYIEAVSVEVAAQAEALNLKKIPKIMIEPGRSSVAPAGITVYTVGAVKEIPNVRVYASVDGGMADNPRHLIYGSEYSALVANKPDGEKSQVYTIAGRCCESGDVLARDIALPKLEAGDTLCFLATGAYNYSMSSNYNRLPKPPVVMLKKGEDKLILKRETYEDVIRNDLL